MTIKYKVMDGTLCYSRNHVTKAEAIASKFNACEEVQQQIVEAKDTLYSLQAFLDDMQNATITEYTK